MIDRRSLELIGCAVAAFAVVLLGLRLLHRDGGGSVSRGSNVAISTAPAAPARHAPASLLVVSVAGEVRRPGVYRLPAGSRGDAVVRQAGGLTSRADLAGVNLAARLQDGQHVVVPRRGAAPPSAAAGSSAPGATGGPISLSSAGVQQLDGLDGIGPTLAQRIVAYRDAHGGFRSIDELRQVEGIGDKRFQSLKKALQP